MILEPLANRHVIKDNGSELPGDFNNREEIGSGLQGQHKSHRMRQTDY